MTSTTHPIESTPETLYVALELSTKEWWLTMSPTPARDHGACGCESVIGRDSRVRCGPRVSHFGLADDAPVVSCYEAGRDGFWPHRLLTALGVTNLVVDSSSIELPRRARPVKTDRIDGEKLLRLLLAMAVASEACGRWCMSRRRRWRTRATPVVPGPCSRSSAPAIAIGFTAC